jgi:hypothetical protein
VINQILEYEVKPGSNVPQGLARQRLVVLSPIWQAPVLTLEYPDGESYTLMGWSGSSPGARCDLQVFWTRHEAAGPAVCLVIGGDGGMRQCGPNASDNDTQGLPFMALAPSLIPAVVLDVIGPAPAPEPPPILRLT